MIIDRLENAHLYTNLHPDFARAFEWLNEALQKRPTVGRHAIDGDRLFALVANSTGHGTEQAKLEVHRKYIDIQYSVDGSEIFGWRPLRDCSRELEPFNETSDLGFFADQPDSWLSAPPGIFVVFFPEDAHAPLCGEGALEKIVLKVAV